MPDTPHLSDEEWMQAVRDAHAVRAEFYWRIYSELKEKLGEEEALNLIGRACYQMGLNKRERFEGQLADDTPQTFCAVFCTHSPVGCKLFEIVKGEETADAGSVHLTRCALIDGWEKLGVPEHEQAKLCRAAREVDHGTLAGLGFEGEFEELLSEGGGKCLLRVRRKE